MPPGNRSPNRGLMALRDSAGLSQQELADDLNDLAARRYGKKPNITKKTVGRWERGDVEWPQPFYRRLLAERFGCAVEELGFIRPQRMSSMPVSHSIDELLVQQEVVDPRVADDQQHWREVRRMLAGHRRALAVMSERLYPHAGLPGLDAAGILTHPAWLPPEPVPLDSVTVELDLGAAAPVVTGSEAETAALRPLLSTNRRYARYSHAIRDLAAPRLFENRLCFRITEVDLQKPAAKLRFGLMSFFDSIDTNEALAHETALHHLGRNDNGNIATTRPSWRRLAFRKLIGDPFDLSRRPLMGAIGTLTVRAGECPSMILHQRDGAQVAGGGSMIHLLPAGIFQPCSVLPESVAADFSPWRNIQREYAEELLGQPECDGTGQPIDYTRAQPFIALDQAVAEGRLRVYCLGVTLDALTLCADLLTVAIFEPATYDAIFSNSVAHNSEGSIPTQALPFEHHTIAHLTKLNVLSPGASAAIHLAWKHRQTILDKLS